MTVRINRRNLLKGASGLIATPALGAFVDHNASDCLHAAHRAGKVPLRLNSNRVNSRPCIAVTPTAPVDQLKMLDAHIDPARVTGGGVSGVQVRDRVGAAGGDPRKQPLPWPPTPELAVGPPGLINGKQLVI